MIHEFDYVSMLFDEPENITVSGIEPKAGLSYVESVLTYNNTVVSIEGSSLMPYSYPFTTGYEADFEYGTIEFLKKQSPDKTESSLNLFTKNKCEPIKLKEENCYELAFKDVLDSCKNNKPSILTLENAIKSLKTALSVKSNLSLLK